MGATSIEWTDRSINPIRARVNGATGHYCEKISPGCANCYASRMQTRFGMPGFPGQSGNDAAVPFFDAGRLKEVLARKKPTKWFWADMSDLFGRWVPDEWLDQCFAVMAATPRHTHQVLTKRPERMKSYLDGLSRSYDRLETAARGMGYTLRFNGLPLVRWPIPNVWLGTSVEDQKRADERIPPLLQIPAAVRFLSCEPLLGAVDLSPWLTGREENGIGHTVGACVGYTPPVDWVIVGGESGPGSRPCDVRWVKSIRDQCKAAGVACFIKQLGSEPRAKNAMSDGFKCFAQWNGETYRVILNDKKGGDITEFPPHLQVRQFPGDSLTASPASPAPRPPG